MGDPREYFNDGDRIYVRLTKRRKVIDEEEWGLEIVPQSFREIGDRRIPTLVENDENEE